MLGIKKTGTNTYFVKGLEWVNIEGGVKVIEWSNTTC